MLRRIFLRVHRYLGLAAFALLIPIGLTGSVLVFHDEIEAALYPELVRVEPDGSRISIDEAMRTISAAFPADAAARLELPRSPEDPFEAVLRSGRRVYVDPYGGGIGGAPGRGETVTGWLFELHTRLLAGTVGASLVGTLGLVLLALGLSGLVLWFRGWRNVRRRLSICWSGGAQRVNYDAHNVVGFSTVVPLAIVAFTGAGLVFFGSFSHIAHGLLGTPLPPAPPSSDYRPDLPAPSLDLLVRRAAAALPQARPARIDFPSDESGAYRVRLRHPDELHPIGLSMVYLDRYGGEVLHAESALEVSAARRFTYGFYPLHIGSFGGWPVRLIYVLLGLTPTLLAVTGVLIWCLRRRKRRSQVKPNRAAVPVRSGDADSPTLQYAPFD